MNKTGIFFCRCGENIISPDKANGLHEALQLFDADVIELHDLCALAVHEPQVLKALGENYSRKLFVACYPRAVQYLLKQNGIYWDDVQVWNFRESSVAELTTALTDVYGITPGKARCLSQKSALNVPAWFPVVDTSRCTLCGQCARFCVFGVYEYNRKSLTVADPLACKNHCPACGRTCPASAIMFPRLHENSTLTGAVPSAKPAPAAPQPDSLLVRLNNRNSNRRSILREGVVKLAEEERRKALDEWKNQERKGE